MINSLKNKTLNLKKISFALLKFLIFILAFVYISSNFSFGKLDFLQIIEKSNYLYLLLSFFIYVIVFLVSVYKWMVLLNLFISNKRVFLKLMRSCLKGLFVSNFMFGTLAGDVVRIHDQAKSTGLSYKKSIAIAFFDRIYTLIFYILTILLSFYLIDLPEEFEFKAYINYILILFAIFISIIILLKFLTKSNNNSSIIFYNKISNFKSLFKILLLTTFSTLMMGLTFILIAKSLGCHIDISQIFKVQIGLLANYIPLSFSGWGLRELALISLLRNSAQCGDGYILTASIIYGAYGLLISAPGFYFYIRSSKKGN